MLVSEASHRLGFVSSQNPFLNIHKLQTMQKSLSLVFLFVPVLVLCQISLCNGQLPEYVFQPSPDSGSYDLISGGDLWEEDLWLPFGAGGQFVRSVENNFGDAGYSVNTQTTEPGNGSGYSLIRNSQLELEPDTDYVISAFFHTSFLSTGGLCVELANVSGTSLESPIATVGWHFGYRVFNSGSNTSVTFQVVRDGQRSMDDGGFVDKVAITRLADFVPPVGGLKIIANSALEFSNVQGQDGWFYGYYEGPFNGLGFQLMTIFEDDNWYVDNTPAGVFFWTRIYATGCHPNGEFTSGGRTPEEHWVVRRHVFDDAGSFDVIIKARDSNAGGGNGVDLRVYDGNLQVAGQFIANGGSFSTRFKVDATAGMALDFVVDPRNSNDAADATDFEIFIVEERPQITLDNLTIFRGSVVGGGFADLGNSDDQYLRVNPGFILSSLEAPAWLIFDGTVVDATALQIESQAGTPGLSYTAEAWNYDTSKYETIGVQSEQFNVDQVVSFDMTQEHVSSIGLVRNRVGWRSTGFTLNFPWEVRVDHVTWN